MQLLDGQSHHRHGSQLRYRPGRGHSVRATRQVIAAAREPGARRGRRNDCGLGRYGVCLRRRRPRRSFRAAAGRYRDRRFGGLDVAFNNAGAVGELGPVPTMALANWNDGWRRTSPAPSWARNTNCLRWPRGVGALDIHVDICRLQRGHSRHGGLRRQQVRFGRAHAGAGERIWQAGHPCECAPAGRNRHADGARFREYSGERGLRPQSARAEAVSRRRKRSRGRRCSWLRSYRALPLARRCSSTAASRSLAHRRP